MKNKVTDLYEELNQGELRIITGGKKKKKGNKLEKDAFIILNALGELAEGPYHDYYAG